MRKDRLRLEKQIEANNNEIKGHAEVLKELNALKTEKSKLEKQIESKDSEMANHLASLADLNELKIEKTKLEQQVVANNLEIKSLLESLRELNELKSEKIKLENQMDFNNLQITNHLETIKELNEAKLKLEKEKTDYFDLLKQNAGRDNADKNEFNDLKTAFDKVFEVLLRKFTSMPSERCYEHSEFMLVNFRI